jgi:hypothetical protein
MNVGVLQELGSPCHSHGINPGWSYRVTNSGLVVWQTVATRNTKSTDCTRGIAEQPKRSGAKRMSGSRSILIVPMKSGNAPLCVDPVEESEMPHQTTDVGNYVECTET